MYQPHYWLGFLRYLLLIWMCSCALLASAHPDLNSRQHHLEQLQQTTGQADWIFAKAMLYADSDHPGLALEVLKTLTDKTVTDPKSNFRMARLYLRLKQPDLARKYLLNHFKKFPNAQPDITISTHILLAEIAVRQQHPQTAVNHLNQALMLNPELPAHLYVLTIRAMSMANYAATEVFETLKTGLIHHPGYLPLLELNIQQAMTYSDPCIIDQAIEQLLKQYPRHPNWQNNSGRSTR